MSSNGRWTWCISYPCGQGNNDARSESGEPGESGKPGAPARSQVDTTLAVEAAANAKAPTASNDSAGIAANTGGTAKTYGLKDGEVREQGTAAGTRKVRVVGPTL